MNKNIAKKWVAALRSGKYAQASSRLRKDYADKSSFCCLGVLCELHRQEVGGEWYTRNGNDGPTYLRSEALLPETVIEWAGMSHNNPMVPGNEHRPTLFLTSMNDNGASFSAIAAVIEDNVEVL